MNDNSRRRHEMHIRSAQFGVDNAADFTGIATTNFAQLLSKSGSVATKNAALQSGFGEASQQIEIKSTAREDLRDEMSAISRTAKSMEYAFDGISDKFLFRRNMPDADMLAKARAFYDESAVYNSDFIDYGLDATFRADLKAAADAFEDTFTAVDSATAEHIAARADIEAEVRECQIIVRILDGIVRNVYANNPGKLAAWLAASHVEKAPKKKTPPTP